MAAAATPFPREESTPPVMKMILVLTSFSTGQFYRGLLNCQAVTLERDICERSSWREGRRTAGVGLHNPRHPTLTGKKRLLAYFLSRLDAGAPVYGKVWGRGLEERPGFITPGLSPETHIFLRGTGAGA